MGHFTKLGAVTDSAQQAEIIAQMNALGERRSVLIYNIQQFGQQNGWTQEQVDAALAPTNTALFLLQVSFSSARTYQSWLDALAQAAAIYDQLEATYRDIVPDLAVRAPAPAPAPVPAPAAAATVAPPPASAPVPVAYAAPGGFALPDFGGIPTWSLVGGAALVGLLLIGRR